uniref:Kinesin motor domain-containing protein n=1 Tax=Strigamia maritima TaxID=126957 RepID=T1JCQ0_STRMM
MCELSPIKVAIRIRPLIEREKIEHSELFWIPSGDQVISPYSSRQNNFTFDTVFGDKATNKDVFEKVVKPVIDDFLDGYHGTVFAYGQTASGKTHTMTGNEMNPGVIPMTINYIFQFIENTPGRTYLLRFSFIEIYNENVTDLLSSNQVPLKIYDDRDGMTEIVDLSERVVTSRSELLQALIEGEQRRHFGETCMNEKSSRSHTICKMTIESHGIICNEIDDTSDASVTKSHLNLVDLAGSEKCGQLNSKASFKEGCNINRSLLALSMVIVKLSEGNSQHINYRDSKITRILKPSLGGNSKTTIICSITPAVYEESLSTLKFAERAKAVKNNPTLNAISDKESLLKHYENQIQQLKIELEDTKCKQTEVFQKKLQEQNSYINQLLLQEKLRTTSDKLLVSSRHFRLPVISSTQSRRETWCCAPTLQNCSFGGSIKRKVPAYFNKSLRNSSLNVDQDMNTHEKIEDNFISNGNRELFEELAAVKEELASKTSILDDFHHQIIQFLNDEFGMDLIFSENIDSQVHEPSHSRKEMTSSQDELSDEPVAKKLESDLHIFNGCAMENEKFDTQEKYFLQQIAQSNNKHAEIVDQYINQIHHLENEINCLQHQLEEKEMVHEQRLNEFSCDNEQVKELILSLEIQMQIESKEIEQNILEKCKIIQELRSEIESSQKERSTTAEYDQELADLKEKYMLLVEELHSSKSATAVEKDLLLQEMAELRKHYSDLHSSNDSEMVRTLLNELIDSVSIDCEVHKVKNEHLCGTLDLEKDYKAQILELQDINQISEEIISDLKSQVVKSLEEVDAQHEEIEKLKELLRETQLQLNKSVDNDENIQKFLELQQQNSNLQKEFGELKTEVAERVKLGVDAESKYEMELKQLLGTLEQLIKEVGNGKTIQLNLEKQHSDMKEEIACLLNQLSVLNAELTERGQLAEDAQSKHEIELKRLLETVEQLKNEVENRETVQKTLENHHLATKEENANLRDQLEELRTERVKCSHDARSNHEKELKHLLETLEQLRIEVENAEQIQKNLENQHSNMIKENTNLRSQLRELNTELTERLQLAVDVKSKLDQDIQHLLETTEQLKEELKNRETIQKNLEHQHSDVKAENGNLQIQIAELEAELTERLADKIKSKREVESQTVFMTEMTFEKQCSDVKNENIKLQKEVEALKEEINEKVRLADEKQSKLQLECTLMRKTNDELKDSVNHLHGLLVQNELENQSIPNLEKSYYSKKEILEDYEKQIFELLEQQQQGFEEMNTLTRELKELNSKLDENKTAMSVLEQNYKACSQELCAKKGEIESCRESVSRLERDYHDRSLELSAKTNEVEHCTKLMGEMKQSYELQIQELCVKSSEQDLAKTEISNVNKGIEDLKRKIDQLQTAVVKESETKHPATKYEEDMKIQVEKLIESNLRNSILKEKIDGLETDKDKLEIELNTLRNRFVKENEDKLEFELTVNKLSKEMQELETKNKSLAEDIVVLSNRFQNLNTEKVNLEKELGSDTKLRFKELEEKMQSEMTVESLNKKILTFSNRICVLETENSNLEREIADFKAQRLSQQSANEEFEKRILEESVSALEKTYEKQISDLKTDHEKNVQDLKSKHKLEESMMSEKIKFLEEHENETERIVDDSERRLWAMIDAEKEEHKKTKSEMEAVKKLLENSQLSRTPLHTISSNLSNVMRTSSSNKEEFCKPELQLTDSNTELFRKECEINALKIQIKKRDSPFIAKIELLTRECDGYKKRENEMKQELKKMKKQMFESTTNEFQHGGKTALVPSNFGIVDTFKIELLESQVAKLKQQVGRCV